MRRALLPAVLAALLLAPAAGAWTWPAGGAVLQPFVFDPAHPYAAGQHRGIDVGGEAGAAILAPASGTVSFAGSVPASGKSVTIETPDGYSVTLTHLGSIDVTTGASVSEGDRVGTIGPSGDAEVAQPYVHLGVRSTAEAQGYLDPLSLLPGRDAALPADPAPAPDPAPAAVPVATAAAPGPTPAPTVAPPPSSAVVPDPAPAPAAVVALDAPPAPAVAAATARPAVEQPRRAPLRVDPAPESASRVVAQRIAVQVPHRPAPSLRPDAATATPARTPTRHGTPRPAGQIRAGSSVPAPRVAGAQRSKSTARGPRQASTHRRLRPQAVSTAPTRPSGRTAPLESPIGYLLVLPLVLGGLGLVTARRKGVPIIAGDALLRDHADLLRERQASYRACVHDDRRRHPRAASSPARRGDLLPHRRRRARDQGLAGR